MLPDRVAVLAGVAAMAEAEIGQTKQAQNEVKQLLIFAHERSDDGLVADASMTAALHVDLESHLPGSALPMAQAANRYFSSKGEKESEWLSFYYVAKAYKASGGCYKLLDQCERKPLTFSMSLSTLGIPQHISSTLPPAP